MSVYKIPFKSIKCIKLLALFLLLALVLMVAILFVYKEGEENDEFLQSHRRYIPARNNKAPFGSNDIIYLKISIRSENIRKKNGEMSVVLAKNEKFAVFQTRNKIKIKNISFAKSGKIKYIHLKYVV